MDASEDLVRLPRRTLWPLLAGGIAYLVLDYVGNSTIASLDGAPTGDEPVVGTFFARHDDLIHLMAWCIALSGVSLAAFAVGLRRCLGRSPAADAAAAAGVMTGTVIVVSNGVLLAASASRSEEQLELLWHLWNAGIVATLPAALLVLATSLAAYRARGPTWVWATGFPLAAVCLLPPYIGWVTAKAIPIWVAFLAVSLLWGRRWRIDSASAR
jgi:hypothetical protein